MLPDGGRVAVGISGGSDSLALVLLLLRFNRSAPHPIDLVGLHVALDAAGLTGGPGDDAVNWCADSGVPLEIVEPRFDPAETVPLDCFRCARIRRRTLLEAANSRGCGTLALGHHADDVVETWLLSMCYTGTPESLPPRRDYFGGVISVIRPMHEIRQAEIHRLARLAELPQSVPACPREADARRDRVREVLKSFGRDQRLVRRQLYWAAVRQLGDPESSPP